VPSDVRDHPTQTPIRADPANAIPVDDEECPVHDLADGDRAIQEGLITIALPSLLFYARDDSGTLVDRVQDLDAVVPGVASVDDARSSGRRTHGSGRSEHHFVQPHRLPRHRVQGIAEWGAATKTRRTPRVPWLPGQGGDEAIVHVDATDTMIPAVRYKDDPPTACAGETLGVVEECRADDPIGMSLL